MCDSTCCICLNELESDTHTLDCGHKFHTSCVITWFRSNNDTCPMCREVPSVKIKLPDVIHRAKRIINNNLYSEGSFIHSKVHELEEERQNESRLNVQLKEISDFYSVVLKPQKNSIIQKYREERKLFKEKTTPMLKRLDRIDETNRKHKREKKNELIMSKRRQRELYRDIGMYELNSTSEFQFQHNR